MCVPQSLFATSAAAQCMLGTLRRSSAGHLSWHACGIAHPTLSVRQPLLLAVLLGIMHLRMGCMGPVVQGHHGKHMCQCVCVCVCVCAQLLLSGCGTCGGVWWAAWHGWGSM
jgi:hypothetical protein